MSEWYDRIIGELGFVVTGSTPPANRPEWFGDQTWFITPSDIAATERRARPQRKLSEAGTQAFVKRLLPAGSVCFVCIGATIGKLCLTDSVAVTNQQINAIVPKSCTDGTFLYYLLRHVASRIASTAGGAATPILNKSAFAATPVRVPDLNTQRRASSILGAMDDLIEHNRRQVELLEQMTQAIYREWFVRFRYPGHEEVSLAESSLGPIPKDWAVRNCGEMLTILGGGTPSKKEPAYWVDGTIPWYTPSDLTKGRARFAAGPESMITELGLQKSSARLFPAGSVLMTSRATSAFSRSRQLMRHATRALL